MKKALSIAISSVLGVSAFVSTAAQAELTGNVGATSNYLWRGVTQTDDDVAISGGVDYGHESGFYLGTWASNVDFGGDESYEFDLYGGFAGEVGDFGYDIGYIYYAYPDGDSDDDLDFGEIYLAGSWQWFGASAYYLSNADTSSLEESLYLEATAEFELAEGVTLGFAVGNFDFDADEDEDYVNYNASLTKSTQFGDVSFMVSDTDLSGDDPIVTVSWGYEFGLL